MPWNSNALWNSIEFDFNVAPELPADDLGRHERLDLRQDEEGFVALFEPGDMDSGNSAGDLLYGLGEDHVPLDFYEGAQDPKQS